MLTWSFMVYVEKGGGEHGGRILTPHVFDDSEHTKEPKPKDICVMGVREGR